MRRLVAVRCSVITFSDRLRRDIQECRSQSCSERMSMVSGPGNRNHRVVPAAPSRNILP
jgi:hypothetical protein